MFNSKSIGRKLIAFCVVAFLSAVTVHASLRDSLSTVLIEPGLQHVSVTKVGPYAIEILVVDLLESNLRIESFRPTGLVKTTIQARMNDREDHRVVAAVNADFFSFQTGWPVNNQVMNGQFVVASSTQRSHLALDGDGKPCIEKFSLRAWIKPRSGKVYPIDGINVAHRDDAIVLHNCFSDTATKSSGSGMTFLLSLVNTTWSIGDTLKMAVTKNGVTDLIHLGKDQAVLWIGGDPAVRAARSDVVVGDTVLIFLGTSPSMRNITTMVGGVGMIIANGKEVPDSVNVKEKTAVTFLKARHPRTFVGFDRDSTRIFLCVVDGRQTKSLGMNFHEMADFLLSIGAWNAINLDGGGSTTMVISNKIVNSPSDSTGERPVANTLQVIRVNPSPLSR